MKLNQLLLGAAATISLTCDTLAGDYIVRVEAIIESVDGAGSSVAPFSDAQIGDVMVVDYSVSYPGTVDPTILTLNGASIPGINYEIDFAESSVSFRGQSLLLENTVPPGFDDGVSLSSELNGVFGYTGVQTGFLSITCWNLNVLTAPGSLLTSSDLALAVGSSYNPTANSFFSPWLFYSDDFGVNADGLALLVTNVSVLEGGGQVGTSYCQATANSTGSAAVIGAAGSVQAGANNLTLTASSVPASQFGIFLASETQGAMPVASGTLCLGGNIVRFQGPGQILQADASGEFALRIDTQALPASSPTAILPGETWNFTAWYRDLDPVVGFTSNFTNGVSVTFQ